MTMRYPFFVKRSEKGSGGAIRKVASSQPLPLLGPCHEVALVEYVMYIRAYTTEVPLT